MNRTILLLWLLTVALLVVQTSTAYHQLPDRVISHVNLKGEPDGESSKGSLFSTLALAILAVNVWPPVISVIMRKAPISTINLPNREYWLKDPVRRREAAGKMTEMMAALMALVNICFLIVIQAIIDLNQTGEVRIPVWSAVLPLAAVVILVPLYIVTTFRKPASDRPGPTGS